MRRLAKMVIALAWLILVPAGAYAQGSIVGVVKDTSGAVLPGVTVEASSPALIEKTRTGITDGTGQYRIENLRPGTYIVTYTLAGFNTVKREGIELTGSFTATVNAELRVGALEETITVTGETPVVDIQSVTRERVIDHAVIDAIPTGRTERGIGVLIPGVTVGSQDVGGAVESAATNLAIHGGRGGDYRPTQNGVQLSVAQGGGSPMGGASNIAAYEQVAVNTAAGSAEQATGGVQVSFIPKDGGNTFSGTVFGNFANESMQSDNYTQSLKDRRLRTPNTIKRLVEFNPAFGGPIKKDRLWFHTTVRHNGIANYAAGMFHNLNANNPNAWTYAPDLSRRAFNDITLRDGQARLTWQATPKNKFAVHWIQSTTCYCSQVITATVAPEAAIIREFPRMRNVIGEWTSPLTNRLLLEASTIARVEYAIRKIPAESNPLMASVTDQGLGNLVYRAPSGIQRATTYNTLYYRAAVSYITGAHAFKVGFTIGSQTEETTNFHGTEPFTFRFNNGVPNQVTLFATPHDLTFKTDADSGVFVQDKWTTGRLTLSYGVRFDYYKNSAAGQRLWPGPLAPNRDIVLPDAPGVAWRDITPKTGASYDIFGNGKTALKVSLNKYVQGMGNAGIFGLAIAPVSSLVNSTTRSWNDSTFAAGDARRGNFVPDCDLTNPAANGECGQMVNRNFGTAVPGATYDPETIAGWGKRGYNWEFSTGVQHEILPRVSAEISYFRRWFGNFVVTDNRTAAPTDYDAFRITAPAHPDLPGGGGYVISGLYDLNPAKFGVPANDYITFADNFGKQIEHWNGADFTVNARPRPGLLLQGGMSTGRTSTDNCEVVAKLDNPSQLYCHIDTAFLTQIKFLGTYTIPRLDVRVSGAVQSVPGPEILANYNAPNAVVTPSLGRALSGNAANVTVNLVEPGTMYGDRLNQLDLRVGKILRFGKTRATFSLDLYNAFNSSVVLTQNNTFGGSTPWQQPQSVLLARFAKISVQFDF